MAESKKPFFITASVESIVYLRGERIVNNPVNLMQCKSIQKRQYSWYPDNEGIPAIKFNGCDTEWVYKNTLDRDRDYERIVRNRF